MSLGQIKQIDISFNILLTEKCKYEFWKNQVDRACILMVDNNFEVYQFGNVTDKTLAKGMF